MKKYCHLLSGLVCLIGTMFYSQTSYSQCESNCEIQCVGQLNISLGQDCTAEITPAMGGVGVTPACNSYYTVSLYDEYGSALPSAFVDYNHVNQNLTYKIVEPECGNKCWGNIKIEYKLAPVIECPDDVTVNCSVVDFLCPPILQGSGCADVFVDINLLDEVVTKLDCDPDYIKNIERTYQACDEFGNCNTCSYEIFVERIDITDIKFPKSFTVGNGCAISCCDTLIQFDTNGFPIPWLMDPMTGSGSGVPIYCVPPVVGGGGGGPVSPSICLNGMYPTTGSGSVMIPLIPGNNPICNTFITYTDIEFENHGCVRKIMRTWEVREWWCTDELTSGDIQLIEIVDDIPPVVNCPADFTVTTDYNCSGSVYMPPINPYDKCSDTLTVKIEHPNGIYTGDGGPVELNLGHNVVTYIASDACYNQSSCQVHVTVRDNTAPVAICEASKVVSLSQSSNTIVYAEPFDNGSWDECALDRFEVARMVNDYCVEQDTLFGPHVSFCCSDAGRSDVMVIFRVWDKSGNYSDCMVAVEVQDKAVPALTCPPDMTIDCREIYDTNDLSAYFGAPEVGSGCALNNMVETPITDLDQCGTGSMTRRFDLMDGEGNVARTCKQEIYVTNDSPFYGSNIVWPLDYSTSDICDITNLLPEQLLPPYNEPTFIDQDACALLAYDYDDQVFVGDQGDGACAVIERTWTVINWCGDSDGDGKFDQWVIPQPQLIRITNTQEPVINETGPISFSSQNIDCVSGPISISMTATDDCDNLNWSYDLMNGSDVTMKTGHTNSIDTILKVGSYNIKWKVSDGCGNNDIYIQPVEVLNTKVPSPVCLNGLSANLVLMDLDQDGQFDAEMVELWASDFDGGSSHSCGNPITLSFSQDTSHKNMIFDCNHIGINPVQIYVTDLVSGLQDYCSTFIDIQDNNGENLCEPQDGLRVTVEGNILTEESEMVENVEVSLIRNAIVDTTSNDGSYAFPNMPLGGSYELTPSKDIEYLNGVSTLDIIIIQKHILGKELLESPYKLLASDVDNNQSVSATDLIELRKLILGIYDELPNNDSWRFVDSEHTFIDSLNPWLSQLPETYNINNLVQDMSLDFIGVKIGDVNGSVVTSFNDGEIENRSSRALELTTDITTATTGEQFSIPVYAKNYDELLGLQSTFNFDSERLDLVDIIPGALDIDIDEHVNVQTINSGAFTISYNTIASQTVSPDVVLFEIIVSAKTPIANELLLDVSSDITKSEAYSNNNEVLSVRMSGSALALESKIVQVSPNPWINKAVIDFSIAKPGNTIWEFYNVDGKMLHRKSNYYNTAGQNSLQITRNEISGSGVIYVKLITDDTICEYKMIML